MASVPPPLMPVTRQLSGAALPFQCSTRFHVPCPLERLGAERQYILQHFRANEFAGLALFFFPGVGVPSQSWGPRAGAADETKPSSAGTRTVQAVWHPTRYQYWTIVALSGGTTSTRYCQSCPGGGKNDRHHLFSPPGHDWQQRSTSLSQHFHNRRLCIGYVVLRYWYMYIADARSRYVTIIATSRVQGCCWQISASYHHQQQRAAASSG